MKLSKLILISVACLIFYRLRKPHTDLQQKTSPAESDKKRELDLIRQYAADKQVRYISIVNKIYFAKDKAGQPVSWRHPLGISMSALPANEYGMPNIFPGVGTHIHWNHKLSFHVFWFFRPQPIWWH